MLVHPYRSQAKRLGSCMLAGGLGLFALSCDSNQQRMTEPDVPALASAISVSSSNFQQCGNGDDGGEQCIYINGVLNDSKSLYRESDVIAQRFVIPGLTIGHTYRLAFDYGWERRSTRAT